MIFCVKSSFSTDFLKTTKELLTTDISLISLCRYIVILKKLSFLSISRLCRNYFQYTGIRSYFSVPCFTIMLTVMGHSPFSIFSYFYCPTRFFLYLFCNFMSLVYSYTLLHFYFLSLFTSLF